MRQLRLFPTCLKLRLREAEIKFALDVKVLRYQLKIDKDGNTTSGLFWYNLDNCFLIERVMTGTICEGKFENLSSSPASGIQWSSSSVAIEEAMKQPLCQYEQGSECYENLKATIYNSKYPVRQLLQGLLDNKCCFIALSVIGDDEEK